MAYVIKIVTGRYPFYVGREEDVCGGSNAFDGELRQDQRKAYRYDMAEEARYDAEFWGLGLVTTIVRLVPKRGKK